MRHPGFAGKAPAWTPDPGPATARFDLAGTSGRRTRPGRNEPGEWAETRHYLLETSALKDWRGLEIGRLLLLHDVTGQKRAEAQLVDQQRALATLKSVSIWPRVA